MTTSTERKVIDTFVDAGVLAADTGTLTAAATTLAGRLIAEGHGAAVAELTAVFWSANDARLARRDRWDAHRAALDPGEKEPPPPPTKPDDPAPPGVDPAPEPPADGTGAGS